MAQTALLILLQHGIIAPQEVAESVFPVILRFTEPHAHDDHRTEITAVSNSMPFFSLVLFVEYYCVI